MGAFEARRRGLTNSHATLASTSRTSPTNVTCGAGGSSLGSTSGTLQWPRPQHLQMPLHFDHVAIHRDSSLEAEPNATSRQPRFSRSAPRYWFRRL